MARTGELPAHMAKMPKNFLVLRVFQLVFAVILMGLTIFGVIVLPLNSLCVMVFTCFATAITVIYIISAQRCAPSLYNYWAILALEIFCLIFWLISFALVAADTATLATIWSGTYSCDDYGYCYDSSMSIGEATFVAICGAAAGLGALEFIFFLVSLIIFSIALYRHRKNGGHCKYVKDGLPPPPFNTNNDVGGEKLQMQPQTQAYPISTSTTPAPQGYYEPPPQFQQQTAYSGAPIHNGQQYQAVPQYPQQMPQQLTSSPAPTYSTPVQSYPPQNLHQ